jgi:hypothetical protein
VRSTDSVTAALHMGLSFRHHTRSPRPGSRANTEQSYGSSRPEKIISGCRKAAHSVSGICEFESLRPQLVSAGLSGSLQIVRGTGSSSDGGASLECRSSNPPTQPVSLRGGALRSKTTESSAKSGCCFEQRSLCTELVGSLATELRSVSEGRPCYYRSS